MARHCGSGNGLGIANGNGVSGNPTISLNGIVASLAGVSGTGILSTTGSSISTFTMAGTTSQITIANPNGVGTPTFALASNPILPGNQSVTIPAGTTAQQGTGQNGMIRFNTDNTVFEGYSGGTWRTFSLSGGVVTFSAGTTGLSPSTPTNGNIVLSGTLNAANGGTGASTLTGYVYGNGTGVMTASTTVPTTSLSGTVSNAQLANSSITINGNTVSLGGSTTVTAVTTSALTIGTGLSGTSFNGSAPVTIAIATTGVSANTYGSASVIPVITVNAQGQITSVTNASTNAPAYQGTWNASTNSPTLTSSVGTQGYYYVVSTAGTTSLNGVANWSVGDWAIFSGGTWEKIPGSNSESFTTLTTVNLAVTGLTGYMYANGSGNVTASSTIAIANGGTGQTTSSAAFNALSPITTTGDLIIGNGTNSATRLAIGANTFVLTSNGTTASWQASSGGGGSSSSANAYAWFISR